MTVLSERRPAVENLGRRFYSICRFHNHVEIGILLGAPHHPPGPWPRPNGAPMSTDTTPVQDLLNIVGAASLVRREVEAFAERLGPHATEADVLQIARRAAVAYTGSVEGAALFLPLLVREMHGLGLLGRFAGSESGTVPLGWSDELH